LVASSSLAPQAASPRAGGLHRPPRWQGKEQRGTSRREDIHDVVLNLRHPAHYEPSQGCRFEVHFEKARGLTGDVPVPFEAKLKPEREKAVWTTRTLEDAHYAEILELKKEGMSIRNIAKELGMSKSAVQRALAKKPQRAIGSRRACAPTTHGDLSRCTPSISTCQRVCGSARRNVCGR
jgi:Helix-turn-helix domain